MTTPVYLYKAATKTLRARAIQFTAALLHLRRWSAGKWDARPTANCAWCGRRSNVPQTVLAAIRDIAERYGLAQESSRRASLPSEALHEPRLLSRCQHCGRPLKFNPYIVDNRGCVQVEVPPPMNGLRSEMRAELLRAALNSVLVFGVTIGGVSIGYGMGILWFKAFSDAGRVAAYVGFIVSFLFWCPISVLALGWLVEHVHSNFPRQRGWNAQTKRRSQ